MSNKVEYRGHQIIYGLVKKLNAAQVYKGMRIVNPQRLTGASAEVVIQDAKAWIDESLETCRSQRRTVGEGTSHPFQVGTVEEYVTFLETEPLSHAEQAMLTGHAAAPQRTMSAGDIAASAGWTSFSAANANYGKLGARIAEKLELRLPRRRDGSEIQTCAIATSADPDWGVVDGLFRWTMHEEMAEALRRCNIVGQQVRS